MNLLQQIEQEQIEKALGGKTIPLSRRATPSA